LKLVDRRAERQGNHGIDIFKHQHYLQISKVLIIPENGVAVMVVLGRGSL